MMLSSVRALKAELIAEPELRTVSPNPTNTTLLMASALPSRPKPTAMALGISRVGKTYRLAVRLQHAFPGSQTLLEQIRKKAKGEIDIRIVGKIVKQQPWHMRRHRPLRIGSSIAHIKNTAGTLGCFVTPDGTKDLILSNNHVFANENLASKGDTIVQPGPYDNGKSATDSVGALSKFVRLRTTTPNFVDCATADLDDVEYYYNELKGLGPITGIRTTLLEEDEPVFKIGRTTGLTEGWISATEVDDVMVGYDMGDLRFDNQIEIAPLDSAKPFSLGGDSGSLIVDEDRKAVGLLFAGNDRDTTYANPIQTVLDELSVNLVF